MTFDVGSILLVKDYQLPTKVSDKFFIVICKSEEDITLMSMTTSQVYFDISLIKHGLIVDREMSLYCFQQDKIIGLNGFSFRKHTFVSLRKNIHEFSKDKIDSHVIEYQDRLIKEELINLVYSFYRSKTLAKKYAKRLEDLITELSE